MDTWEEAAVPHKIVVLHVLSCSYQQAVCIHNHQHVNIHSLGQVHSFKCVATCSDLILTPVGDYETLTQKKLCLYAVKEM